MLNNIPMALNHYHNRYSSLTQRLHAVAVALGGQWPSKEPRPPRPPDNGATRPVPEGLVAQADEQLKKIDLLHSDLVDIVIRLEELSGRVGKEATNDAQAPVQFPPANSARGPDFVTEKAVYAGSRI